MYLIVSIPLTSYLKTQEVLANETFIVKQWHNSLKVLCSSIVVIKWSSNRIPLFCVTRCWEWITKSGRKWVFVSPRQASLHFCSSWSAFCVLALGISCFIRCQFTHVDDRLFLFCLARCGPGKRLKLKIIQRFALLLFVIYGTLNCSEGFCQGWRYLYSRHCTNYISFEIYYNQTFKPPTILICRIMLNRVLDTSKINYLK